MAIKEYVTEHLTYIEQLLQHIKGLPQYQNMQIKLFGRIDYSYHYVCVAKKGFQIGSGEETFFFYNLATNKILAKKVTKVDTYRDGGSYRMYTDLGEFFFPVRSDKKPTFTSKKGTMHDVIEFSMI